MLQRRTLLVLAAFSVAVVSILTVGVAGSTQGQATQPVSVETPTERTPNTHDGAAGSTRPTIPGEVTTAPTFADGRVLVGTDRGLSVFVDGQLRQHVRTQPVRRVVPVGEGTAVVLVDDEYFPNVKAIDTDSGEVAWSASHTVDVYSPDFGEVTRQARPADAAPVGDVTGDGTADVAVAVGQSVVVFDGETGERVWTHDHGTAVWSVDAAGGTVYAGTQDGRVLGLNADSGEADFERQLVEAFEVDGGETADRSVWTVEHTTVGGSDRVVATGEDGSVHLLEPDGEVAWREQVVEFDEQALGEYYQRLVGQNRLTLPGDGLFRAIEATVVGRDGTSGVAVTVSPPEFARRVTLQNAPQSVHLLDAASGQSRWSTTDVDLDGTGSVAYSPGGSALLVPRGPTGSTQQVLRFDVETGERTEISSDVIPPRDRAVQDASTGYVAAEGGRVALATTAGALRVGSVDGSVDWSYPAFRNVGVKRLDLTGDDVADYLFVSRDATGRTGGPLQSRGLFVRDGSNGSLVWSTAANASTFASTGGYADLQPIADQEGGTDLLAVRYPSRQGENAPAPSVTIIDGENGTRLLDARPGRIRVQSAVAVGDVSGRKTLAISFRGGIGLLDLESGSEYGGFSYGEPPNEQVTQWRPFEGEPPARYVSVGDGDGDGIREMVALSWQGRVATVSIESAQSIETLHRMELGRDARIQAVRPAADLTGDGYDEVPIETDGEDGPVLAVYAPGQGEVVERIEQARPDDLRRVAGDVTGDGAPTAVVAQGRSDSPAVTVYSGMDRVLRHEFDRRGNYRQAGVETPSPAATAGDVDGDGADEVAVVEASTAGGARVNLTDATTGDVVESVELGQFVTDDARTMPGVYAQSVPDRTGDGNPELGVVTGVAGNGNLDVRYYVVDPQAGEVLLGGEGRATEFFPVGDSEVGVVTPDGSVSVVNPTTGVSIANTDAGTNTAVTWEFDDDDAYVSRVYVDGQPVSLTDGTETTVRLPPGEHTIQVRATDADGVTVYDATTVEVAGGSSLDLVLFGATFGALAVLLVPYLLRLYRRRP